MSGAVIVINQPGGAGAGAPGVAHNEIWQNQPVVLNVGTSGNSGVQWLLLDTPKGSSAVMNQEVFPGTSATFTPDVVGSYLIQLIVNGGGSGNVQTLVARCRYDNAGNLANRGWAYPAVGEQDGASNYAGNVRGWSEVIESIFEDIRLNAKWGAVDAGIDILNNGDPVCSGVKQLNFVGASVSDESDEYITVTVPPPPEPFQPRFPNRILKTNASGVPEWTSSIELAGTISVIGSGSINLDPTGGRLRIGGEPVLGAGLVTAESFIKLFDSSEISTHTHPAPVIPNPLPSGAANQILQAGTSAGSPPEWRNDITLPAGGDRLITVESKTGFKGTNLTICAGEAGGTSDLLCNPGTLTLRGVDGDTQKLGGNVYVRGGNSNDNGTVNPGNASLIGGTGLGERHGGGVSVCGGEAVFGKGGAVYVQGGYSGVGAGGDTYIIGGNTEETTGGRVYIAGGVGYSSEMQSPVVIGMWGDHDVRIGTESDGIQVKNNTLAAFGVGAINLDSSGDRLKIKKKTVPDHTGITAENFSKLFDGSEVLTHTHKAEDIAAECTGPLSTAKNVQDAFNQLCGMMAPTIKIKAVNVVTDKVMTSGPVGTWYNLIVTATNYMFVRILRSFDDGPWELVATYSVADPWTPGAGIWLDYTTYRFRATAIGAFGTVDSDIITVTKVDG